MQLDPDRMVARLRELVLDRGMAVVAERRLRLDEQRRVVRAVRLVAPGAVVVEERLVLHRHVGERSRRDGWQPKHSSRCRATRMPLLFDACGLWQSMHQPSLAGGCVCIRLSSAPIGWHVKQSLLGAWVSSPGTRRRAGCDSWRTVPA